MKACIFFLFLSFTFLAGFSQGFPWNNPLMMQWSSDGIIFNSPSVFQDSAGVPSVIKWKGDTLIAAFQWFRQPNPSPSWDRVAVKFSYDNGLTWTQPTPIIVNGLPAGYQRPFDPTLTVFNNDSIRIYFSSSAGMPSGGLDSTVNTYSAKSADGIHYEFEPAARVDELSKRVIDPAVIYFNTGWHYMSPVGAPQEGAYHYVSPDGINFNPVPLVPSDMIHNWTGNYMIENTSELRFYGCGQNIWYNTTPNGGVWNGYVNTNVHGGDPSVVKITGNNYLIVYVGPSYLTGVESYDEECCGILVTPNPAGDFIVVSGTGDMKGCDFNISDMNGKCMVSGKIESTAHKIGVYNLPVGLYVLHVIGKHDSSVIFRKK